MTGPAIYFHAGFILISAANLVVILLLIVVFAVAISIQLPPGEPVSTPANNADHGASRKEGGR